MLLPKQRPSRQPGTAIQGLKHATGVCFIERVIRPLSELCRYIISATHTSAQHKLRASACTCTTYAALQGALVLHMTHRRLHLCTHTSLTAYSDYVIAALTGPLNSSSTHTESHRPGNLFDSSTVCKLSCQPLGKPGWQLTSWSWLPAGYSP